MTELENDISTAQNRNQTLSEINKELNRKIELLQQSKSSIDSKMEQQLHTQNEMIKELEKEIQEYQSKVEQYRTKSTKKDRLILEFKQKMDEAIKKIKEQVAEIEERDHKITELEPKIKTIQNRSISPESQKKWEKEIDGLTRIRIRLEGELKERDKEVQDLRSQLEHIDTSPQITELKNQILSLQAEIEQKQLAWEQERQNYEMMDHSLKEQFEIAQVKISEIESQKILAEEQFEQEILHLKNAHQEEIELLRMNMPTQDNAELLKGGKKSGDPQLAELIRKLRLSNAKLQEYQLKARKNLKALRELEEHAKKSDRQLEKLRKTTVLKKDFKELKQKFNELTVKYEAMAKNREILLNENESLRIQLEIRQPTEQPSPSTPSTSSNQTSASASGSVSTPKVPLRKLRKIPKKSTWEKVEDNSVAEVSLHISRIKCPHCGSTKLKEIEDKSTILSYVPQIVYAKKLVCTQCGYIF
ncbi:MAG: hypothetical protein ACTSUK_09085 [Promethearchaeota archaeon]